MKISINDQLVTPDKLPYEVVERKGLGHPDTLTDGIVEAAEIAYCDYCLKEFGCIPHHNFDKAMMLGGKSIQTFGSGKFVNPIRTIFMGRGSKSFGDKEIPLEEIQIDAAKKYITRILPHLDVNDKKIIQFSSETSSHSTRPFWFNPKSIKDLPEYNVVGPTANDTATMISYWPLTPSEKLALDIEGYFYENDEEGLPHPRFKEFGGDIKVMIVRDGDKINATVVIPQIATETLTEQLYFERENRLRKELGEYVMYLYPQGNIDLIVNAQTLGKNPRPYLVTAGSCLDFGEEGTVGRGNKTHGIISSFRPNTMEAPHGKNSTYFVGKVLGYQADVIAKAIYEQTGSPCQIILQANIGDKLYSPSKVIVSTSHNVDESLINSIVKKSLGHEAKTTDLILRDKHYIPRTNAVNHG